MNKKIAYISKWMGGTHGAAQSALDAFRGVARTASNIDLITPRRPADWVLERIAHWVRYFERPVFPKKLNKHFPRKVLKFSASLFFRLGGKGRLDRSNYELALVNGFGSYTLSVDVKAKRKALIVRESPNLIRLNDGSLEAGLAGVRKKTADFDHLIFVSDNVRKEWLKYLDIPEGNTWYVPNCCNEGICTELSRREKREIRHELGFADSDFIVTCVASVQPRKGQDLVITNLPAIAEAVPNLKVLFVGGLDEERGGREILQVLEQSPYRNRVELLGVKRNALEYIYASDVMLLPTRAEALPRVVLESMLLKTPVVASDVDGIPEMVRHEEEGLLFSHDSPEDLGKNVVRVYNDKTLAKALTARAFTRYNDNFTCALLQERYRKTVQMILEDKTNE